MRFVLSLKQLGNFQGFQLLRKKVEWHTGENRQVKDIQPKTWKSIEWQKSEGDKNKDKITSKNTSDAFKHAQRLI